MMRMSAHESPGASENRGRISRKDPERISNATKEISLARNRFFPPVASFFAMHHSFALRVQAARHRNEVRRCFRSFRSHV